MRKIILHINGGMGKNLMATAVAKALKRNQPENPIVVVTAYPQIWLNNENIYRVYRQGSTPYFYEDHIKDQPIKIVANDPYTHEDFIQGKRHLIDVWCEQAGIYYQGELPNIYFTEAEKEVYARRYYSQLPTLVIQSNGGMRDSQRYATSWCRDLPIPVAQAVVDWGNKNGFKVYHIRTATQPQLQNAEAVWRDNIREVWGLLAFSKVRVLIDSFAQHSTVALGLKSIVCWPIDNVKTLGYDLHTNIISNTTKKVPCLIDSYLRDFNITGELHECPFVGPIFEPLDIISKLQEFEMPKMKCLVGDCK